jgi:hypothetical protein
MTSRSRLIQSGERVDLSLEDVADHGESAAHVAVKGAVADGDFALVPGGQQQGAELVGERHHQDAADAGLGYSPPSRRGVVPAKTGAEGRLAGPDGLGDTDRFEADFQVLGENARVVP